MKWRFQTDEIARRFAALVREQGCSACQYVEGKWHVVESPISGTRKSRLISQWSKMTMEIKDEPARERQGKFKL